MGSLQLAAAYPVFWNVVKDFQSLIASIIGLTAVGGAIVGVLLSNRLNIRLADRNKIEKKTATARTIHSFIYVEDHFPQYSLLRVPLVSELSDALRAGAESDLKTVDYLSFLGKMIVGLSDFPSPIADRANFLSWVSARLLMARVQIKNSPVDSDAKLQKVAQEIQWHLVGALEIIFELYTELGLYIEHTRTYELSWCQNNETGAPPTYSIGRGFDISNLKEKIPSRIQDEIEARKKPSSKRTMIEE